MNNYLDNLKKVLGREIKNIYFSLGEINRVVTREHGFLYCYSVYVEEAASGDVIKIYVIDDDGEYRLFSELVDLEEALEFSVNSEHYVSGLANSYRGNILKSIEESSKSKGPAIKLVFDRNRELYLFSGECFEEENGFNIFGDDEMLLIFFAEKDYQKLDFSF